MNNTDHTIERAYRVRLRLKPAQERALSRLLGAKRFVWNWALQRKDEAWRTAGISLSGVYLSRELTLLKKAPQTCWLSELSSVPLISLLRDFDQAWKNFFAGRAKRPRCKRYGSVMAARFTLDQRRTQVDRDAGTVQLDRIGKVRFRMTEPLIGRLRSVTISRDSAGRWFAAFTADGVPLAPPVPAQHAALGVDLGLKDTAALSTGQIIRAPKYLAAKQAKLRRYQRSYCRQRDAALRRMGINPHKRIPKGTRIQVSGRMRRRQRQIGVLHARIANARCNHQHQLTTHVVNTANVIAIEDLNVKAMSRSMRRSFRRSVSDAGLGEVRRQITYKTTWCGRHLSIVDRLYPSSQLCSTKGCDYRHRHLQLKERQWQCPQCHTKHQRDT